MFKILRKHLGLLICLALILATVATYRQVYDCGFVNYDDPAYVTENDQVQKGLTLGGLKWAFTSICCGNWHPLTMLSHMLDCQMFGADNPGWHHLTNLFLHVANTLLLFAVLKEMTGAVWRSAFVAAAFALHPMHVESVAWISQRKGVLSTLFWILSVGAYVRYVRRPATRRYVLALLLFALGLMSKPVLVSLPFVLLLLDYWPLERLLGQGQPVRWRAAWPLVREKVPFFALSAVFCIVTLAVQRGSGAVQPFASLPLIARVSVAAVAYLEYIRKLLWPGGLAVFYPLRPMSLGEILLAILAVGIVSICAVRWRKGHKYLPVGWLWYLGTLVPVIGLVQVGGQAMADRYGYVPFTGLFIVIGWGVPDLLGRWRYRNVLLCASAAAVLLGWSIRTAIQVRHWKDSAVLFEHALEVTEGNYTAHTNLGNVLLDKGQFDEAIDHYRQAIRVSPGFAIAYKNLAFALARKGEVYKAVEQYLRAIEIEPNYAEAHNDLGVVLAEQGRYGEAIGHFRRALEIDPGRRDARDNLAKAEALLRR
jgi:hypothetical protein